MKRILLAAFAALALSTCLPNDAFARGGFHGGGFGGGFRGGSAEAFVRGSAAVSAAVPRPDRRRVSHGRGRRLSRPGRRLPRTCGRRWIPPIGGGPGRLSRPSLPRVRVSRSTLPAPGVLSGRGGCRIRLGLGLRLPLQLWLRRPLRRLDGIWLDQHLLLSGSEPAAAEWGLPVPPRAGALTTTGRRGLRRSRPRTRQVHNRASRAHSWTSRSRAVVGPRAISHRTATSSDAGRPQRALLPEARGRSLQPRAWAAAVRSRPKARRRRRA